MGGAQLLYYNTWHLTLLVNIFLAEWIGLIVGVVHSKLSSESRCYQRDQRNLTFFFTHLSGQSIHCTVNITHQIKCKNGMRGGSSFYEYRPGKYFQPESHISYLNAPLLLCNINIYQGSKRLSVWVDWNVTAENIAETKASLDSSRKSQRFKNTAALLNGFEDSRWKLQRKDLHRHCGLLLPHCCGFSMQIVIWPLHITCNIPPQSYSTGLELKIMLYI